MEPLAPGEGRPRDAGGGRRPAEGGVGGAGHRGRGASVPPQEGGREGRRERERERGRCRHRVQAWAAQRRGAAVDFTCNSTFHTCVKAFCSSDHSELLTVGWSTCDLQTIHCNFASVWKQLSAREVLQLENITEAQSAEISDISFHLSHALSLQLLLYPGEIWSQKNQRCSYLPEAAQELHKEQQYLYVHPSQVPTLHGSSVPEKGDLLNTWGCSVGFGNAHLGEGSVWCALHLHSRAPGTRWQLCAAHGSVVKGRDRARSGLLTSCEGLWFQVFYFYAIVMLLLCHTWGQSDTEMALLVFHVVTALCVWMCFHSRNPSAHLKYGS